MKNYESKLVAKCYTKPGRLNRPRRCKSRCEKTSLKTTWGPGLMWEYLKDKGSLHLTVAPY